MKRVTDAVEQADMVLVGIGEEMDTRLSDMSRLGLYSSLYARAKEQKAEWLIPFLFAHFLMEQKDEKRKNAYGNLEKILEGKNYYIVTTCMDGILFDSGLNRDKITAPCGGYKRLQCTHGCKNNLQEAYDMIEQVWQECIAKQDNLSQVERPVCPLCNQKMVLNNMNENYDEAGYLPGWEKYTKWLQGTLNKKLCILEIGVGMKYPTVIRWPFERVAFLNQKSCLIRIHGSLYHMSAELAGKGISIPADSLDFLGKKL